MVRTGNEEQECKQVRICLDLDEPVRGKVRALLDQFKKEKFLDLLEQVEAISADDAKTKKAFPSLDLALLSDDALTRLTRRIGLESLPPCIVFLKEFNEARIRELYIHGYPVKAFFLEKVVSRDPEEMGVIASALKSEIRKVLIRRHGETFVGNVKKLGWKCGGARPKNPADRRFVTLMADAKMRECISDLSYWIRRLGIKQLPDPKRAADFLRTFGEIGAAVNKEDGPLVDTLAKRAEGLSEPTQFSSHHLLVQGETGTGKTLIAGLIRDWAVVIGGKDRPFEHVSTVNISPDLLDSELFGAIYGGYTDSATRPGRLLRAYGGVVFIDELGSLSLVAQSKLLIYLDSFKFRPVGWPYNIDIVSPAIVVAATNADLPRLVREGKFRDDLLRRFRCKVNIPPLRARKGDFRVLADYVLQDPTINPDRKIEGITVSALDKLERYGFPGNFRELEDILSVAVKNADSDKRDIILREDIQFG